MVLRIPGRHLIKMLNHVVVLEQIEFSTT